MISILTGIVLLLFIAFQGCAEGRSLENAAFLWLECGKKINATSFV